MAFNTTAAGLTIWIVHVLVSTFLIYWLWNEVLLKTVTFVRPIDFWQSLGVAILARLLFGPNIVYERDLATAFPLPRARATVRRRRRKARK